jgi:hypothetical protein
MRSLRKALGIFCLFLCVGLVLSPVFASEEIRVLTGEHWMQLANGQKVMFIAGVCSVVEFERHLIGKDPALQSKSFIPHLISGLSGQPIGEVVERIDAYYEVNPQERSRPVFDTIFQVMVFPRKVTK